jgi:hypothetical protein
VFWFCPIVQCLFWKKEPFERFPFVVEKRQIEMSDMFDVYAVMYFSWLIYPFPVFFALDPVP